MVEAEEALCRQRRTQEEGQGPRRNISICKGQHGNKRMGRRKASDYSVQLREKQRARRIYGVLESQFRRMFAQAERRPGITGVNPLQLLEQRLDNVVFRLGYADSRAQARHRAT